jgi:RNA polymerase sigma-70 factor (ECF subfamily)
MIDFVSLKPLSLNAGISFQRKVNRAVDDRELVERCLAGDQDGLRTFIEQFQGWVFALCFRQLGHRQDAEDVAQESLARAVRHLSQWDQVRPLKPWILTIAVNRCRTHLSRRLTRAKTVAVDVEPPARHVRLGGFDLAEELQLALQQLRDEYRTCFLLFHQQELSLHEVAKIMNCPDGTIKTWLHRARRELANLLRARGVVTEEGHELFRI